jgi:hypothetical protein
MIKEISNQVTYQKTITTRNFEINGKTVRVYTHEFFDEYESDCNTEIDEQDKAKLTEEDLDELSDNL